MQGQLRKNVFFCGIMESVTHAKSDLMIDEKIYLKEAKIIR